jgi:hypothetical protein
MLQVLWAPSPCHPVNVPESVIPHELVRRIMRCLGEKWPGTMSFNDLSTAVLADGDTNDLQNALLQLYGLHVIELCTIPRVSRSPTSSYPRADPLARLMCPSTRRVTSSLIHRSVKVSKLCQSLLPLLDGTRTIGEVQQALASTGSLNEIQNELEHLARNGLLNCECDVLQARESSAHGN